MVLTLCFLMSRSCSSLDKIQAEHAHDADVHMISFILLVDHDTWLTIPILKQQSFLPILSHQLQVSSLPIHLSDASNIKNKQFHHVNDCKQG